MSPHLLRVAGTGQSQGYTGRARGAVRFRTGSDPGGSSPKDPSPVPRPYEALFQFGEQIRQLGKPADLLLRPDRVAVRDHVELTLLPRDHLGVVPEAVQLRHETRGAFVVAVSDRAVVDRNARHKADSSVRETAGAAVAYPCHAVKPAYTRSARRARSATAPPHRVRWGRRRVLGGLVELGVRVELCLDDLDDLAL
jgi:hypothetical protein